MDNNINSSKVIGEQLFLFIRFLYSTLSLYFTIFFISVIFKRNKVNLQELKNDKFKECKKINTRNDQNDSFEDELPDQQKEEHTDDTEEILG